MYFQQEPKECRERSLSFYCLIFQETNRQNQTFNSDSAHIMWQYNDRPIQEVSPYAFRAQISLSNSKLGDPDDNMLSISYIITLLSVMMTTLSTMLSVFKSFTTWFCWEYHFLFSHYNQRSKHRSFHVTTHECPFDSSCDMLTFSLVRSDKLSVSLPFIWILFAHDVFSFTRPGNVILLIKSSLMSFWSFDPAFCSHSIILPDNCVPTFFLWNQYVEKDYSTANAWVILKRLQWQFTCQNGSLVNHHVSILPCHKIQPQWQQHVALPGGVEPQLFISLGKPCWIYMHKV